VTYDVDVDLPRPRRRVDPAAVALQSKILEQV
jgi:hypothetical protein